MVKKQVEALREAVKALDIRPEHGALVAYCEGIASVIDEHPERATLWREYRPALEMLLTVGEVASDDGQAALLELVSTPVGDPKKTRARKPRAGGGGGGGDVGPAVDAVAATGRGRRPRAAS